MTTIEMHKSDMERQTIQLPALSRQPRPISVLPLSEEQQVYWFFEKNEVFMRNEHLAMRFPFVVDPEIMEMVLGEILQQHEILRATFQESAEGSVSWGRENADWYLNLYDFSSLPAQDSEKKAAEIAVNLVGQNFDLKNGPLFRASLFLANKISVFLLVLPHIVCDAWSLRIIQNAINTLYYELIEGRGLPPSKTPIQYADYSIWQQSAAALILEKNKPYWSKVLANATPVKLPPKSPSATGSVTPTETVDFFIPATLSNALSALARLNDSTLFVTMVAAFKAVLGRLLGSADLTIGAITTGRQSRDLLDIVGPFANYVPVRTRLERDRPFPKTLKVVDEAVRGAMAHSVISVPKLAMSLGIDPAICNIVVNFVNASMFNTRAAVEWKVPGADTFDYHFPLLLEELDIYMDLQLLVIGGKDGCFARFLYKSSLLDRAVVVCMADDMLGQLQAAIAD